MERGRNKKAKERENTTFLPKFRALLLLNTVEEEHKLCTKLPRDC